MGTEAAVSVPPVTWLFPRQKKRRARRSSNLKVEHGEFLELCSNGEKDAVKALLLKARSDPDFDVNKLRARGMIIFSQLSPLKHIFLLTALPRHG